MSEEAMQGDIVDRLRGRYPCGLRLPNGEPEFGWREFDPDMLAHLLKKPSGIMLEAAKEIERLRAEIDGLKSSNSEIVSHHNAYCQCGQIY